MRMFQSSSRHSSEQSTAQNSSRPIASQLKGISHTISNWFENYRPQRTQISTVTSAPFPLKLESNGLQVDENREFRAYFSTPAIFKATSKLIGSLGWSNDKNWLDFSSIFFQNCRFRSSTLPFAVSFHFTRSDTRVKWCDLPKPITILSQRIATNGIASFCTNHNSLPTHSNQWDCFILYRS